MRYYITHTSRLETKDKEYNNIVTKHRHPEDIGAFRVLVTDIEPDVSSLLEADDLSEVSASDALKSHSEAVLESPYAYENQDDRNNYATDLMLLRNKHSDILYDTEESSDGTTTVIVTAVDGIIESDVIRLLAELHTQGKIVTELRRVMPAKWL